MISLLKARSFWDYALFALMLIGMLVGVFWVNAGYRVGWGDAAFALIATVLFVSAISVLARSSERTKRMVRSTWQGKLLLVLGTAFFIFGSLYADAYFIHHIEITASRLRHDAVLGIALALAVLSGLRGGIAATRRHLH